MVTERINDNGALVNYEDAISERDNGTWKRHMELRTESLNKLRT